MVRISIAKGIAMYTVARNSRCGEHNVNCVEIVAGRTQGRVPSAARPGGG